MSVKNYVKFEFLSIPENVSFARSCVGAFAAQMECTLEQIEEVKLVVSEAVSNSIIHGYENRATEKVTVMASILDDRSLEIMIEDQGKGIADIAQAMEPAFSTDSGRMGMGFTFMKSFMDELDVISFPDKGTTVRMRRSFLVHDNEAYA